MSQPIALVFMAAGMGSRFGGLKQLAEVGPHGEALIDYGLYDAVRAGFERIVFVIRRDFEQAFRERVGRRAEAVADVRYAYQELDDLPEGFAIPDGREKPWGTGHAIRSCREVIDGPFAVVNADDFYGRSAYQTVADYLKGLGAGDHGKHALAAYVLANTLSPHGSVTRGICTADTDGLLTGIDETSDIQRGADGVITGTSSSGASVRLADDSLASMNFWALAPDFLAELDRLFIDFLQQLSRPQKQEFYLPMAVDSLLSEGTASARVLPVSERWLGVTYREDLPEVQRAIAELIAAGSYPEHLWEHA